MILIISNIKVSNIITFVKELKISILKHSVIECSNVGAFVSFKNLLLIIEVESSLTMWHTHVALSLVDGLLVLLKVHLFLFLDGLEWSAVFYSVHIEVLILGCILFHTLHFFQTGIFVILGAEVDFLFLWMVDLDGFSLVG